MESASSLEHLGTTAALPSAYGDYQIGPFENFHQFVEETLIVVGSRLQIFLQYALRFADGLKSQLLISHRFLPIRLASLELLRFRREGKIKSLFRNIHSIFISMWNSRAESSSDRRHAAPIRDAVLSGN
jgi:hypothetical protein